MRELAAVASFAILLSTAGCGGGGGGGSNTSTAANVQAITVGPGPSNNVNLLFTSVTICAPGTTRCQAIDHLQVDTGSTGLRIVSSVLSPALALPQQTDGSGSPVAACGQFVDGFTWGPVKMADVRISGELASSVPIQVIGDPAFPTVPTCAPASLNSVQALGANGLLGLGLFQQDCGSACALSPVPGHYYVCPSGVCQVASIGLGQQLQNPVGMFPVDNNGVIIALPLVSATGADSVSGSLIFGIGTQGNNGLGNAHIVRVDQSTGVFNTIFNGSNHSNSFIDTGSNALYFADASIPSCPGPASSFYCPASTQNLVATIQGADAVLSTVGFQVANADSLFVANPNAFAFGNLAGPNPGMPTSFDWGLPFFFGRNVFIAIEGRSTPVGGAGPYFAY